MKHLFSIVYEGKEYFNFLAQEGEQSILNVYLLGQALPSLYLCLLNATPTASTTMGTMSEFLTPGTNGYNRVQINTSDWSAPVLNGGNYTTSSGLKSFGPASGSPWAGITYVGIVTASSGTGGKFIAAIPLPQADSVALGFNLTFILNSSAITV